MSQVPENPAPQTEPDLEPVPAKPSLSTLLSNFDLTPIFIFIALGLVVGRIVQEKKPAYGHNDGSRWNTVYYLVEHGTYEMLPDHGADWGKHKDKIRRLKARGQISADNLPPRFVGPFDTIDMVKVGDKYYSSKPPLFPTVVAGVAWLLERVTCTDFRTNPWFITKATLILVQVVPFVICFLLIRSHIYRLTNCVYVRNLCVGAAALATYLTPWSAVLNNHVVGAFAAMLALHAAFKIWYDGRREWYWFVMAGIFAAFTATVELPAALFALALFVALTVKDWKRSLIFGLTAALIPVAGMLITNYLALGTVVPAYAQVDKSEGIYNYPGSYWNNPTGIDALGDTEPRWFYAMNALVGHHGFFALTPIFILSLVGLAAHLRRGFENRRMLALFVLLLTGAMVVFYTFKTNNYGGACQGFRWLFWLIPMWLIFLPAGVELVVRWLAGRLVCYLVLGVSMVSVSCALQTPWSSPWFHRLFVSLGWINY